MDLQEFAEFVRQNPQIPSGEVARKFQDLQGKKAITARSL